MSPRWTVETTRDSFEDVGADDVRIEAGGSLVFYDPEGEVLVAYAPGVWRTVGKEES